MDVNGEKCVGREREELCKEVREEGKKIDGDNEGGKSVRNE